MRQSFISVKRQIWWQQPLLASLRSYLEFALPLKCKNCWRKWNLSHFKTFEKLKYHTGYLSTSASESLVYRWFSLKLWDQKTFGFQEYQYPWTKVSAFSFLSICLLILFCIPIYLIGNMDYVFRRFNYSAKSKTLYCSLILFSVPLSHQQ